MDLDLDLDFNLDLKDNGSAHWAVSHDLSERLCHPPSEPQAADTCGLCDGFNSSALGLFYVAILSVLTLISLCLLWVSVMMRRSLVKLHAELIMIRKQQEELIETANVLKQMVELYISLNQIDQQDEMMRQPIRAIG
ncbi:uncharacterized protein LOC131935379 [Physella acuta]|uniref:uncharacterized protein LOC131935379 n=1 Tax=Physella acuta TaxID=109671 RepID=UPI0027DE9994|nr:uncharacterized protein LOC131935379 [Physella acuta]